MSKIEVDAIEPQSGTSLTLGASGDTLTIPSGATLVNNGTASGFGDNLEWQSSIVTAATITVTANKGYWIDTTSNACTITLPAAAAVGDRLIFTDYARNWATNAVTINQNSLNFQGNTSPNPVYDTNGQSVDIVYSGATKGWIPNSDDDVTLETPQWSGTAYYLVVGGGGGGGSTYSPNTTNGAGGGAGGYRTNYGGAAYTLGSGITYTITVGTGGAGATLTGTTGTGGNNSSLTGSDITDVTATGGGGGGSSNGASGQTGGSGGGGTNGSAAGSGNSPSTTPAQGFNGGGNDGSTPNYGAGGGGGASEVGGAGTGTVAGDGGDGNSNSITGSAVIYAGGGGGGTYNGGTVGSGGTGGGGNAGSASSPGAVGGNGTDGLGGGGGGATYTGTHFVGGDGGNGVVIVRLSTSDYNEVTVTGTHTTAVSGSDTIITWTASPATLVT
jgi:hypothetical protein